MDRNTWACSYGVYLDAETKICTGADNESGDFHHYSEPTYRPPEEDRPKVYENWFYVTLNTSVVNSYFNDMIQSLHPNAITEDRLISTLKNSIAARAELKKIRLRLIEQLTEIESIVDIISQTELFT